jgi:hypothetical protein
VVETRKDEIAMKTLSLVEGRKRAKAAGEKVSASANKGKAHAAHGIRRGVRNTKTYVQQKGRQVSQVKGPRESTLGRFLRSVKQVLTTIGPRRLLMSIPAALTASWAYRRLRRGKR